MYTGYTTKEKEQALAHECFLGPRKQPSETAPSLREGPARWPRRSRQLLNPGSPQLTSPLGDHSGAELQGFVHSCGVQVAWSLYKVAFN